MSPVSSGAALPVPGSHEQRASGFRPDIQGLRALAVGLVVLDHARIGPFHGGFIGVDVFFVISGFLITGLLLGEADRQGRISAAALLRPPGPADPARGDARPGRHRRREYFLLSGIDAVRVLKDAVWATFFAANIKFARDETNYWAAGRRDLADPALLVPGRGGAVLPGVAAGRARRWCGSSVAAAATAGPSSWPSRVISVASFAWASTWSATDPLAAYFSTPARAWELGLGAAVAAALLRSGRLPGGLLAGASWLGLAMVGSPAILFDEGTRVPGYAALLPVVGTALLLGGGAAAASAGGRSGCSASPRCAGSATGPTRTTCGTGRR